MQELIGSCFDLNKRVTDDADFGAFLRGRIFELVYNRLGNSPPGA